MTKDMPARLLELLSLLQGRREWSGGELAARLGVTTRTVRRDVDRLRGLGYPVSSTGGTAGGYSLVSGAHLPPLLLADDEAVAIAVGLRTATSGTVAGMEESTVRALAKLEQILPARLYRRVAAVTDATVVLPYRRGRAVDPTALALLAAACRDHEVVTFGYENRAGEPSNRQVEPHSLVAGHGRWYLLGYDTDRADWRTFRVDRVSDASSTRRTFRPRQLPAADAREYLRRTITTAQFRYSARATVQAPADEVTSRLRSPIPGRVEAAGEHVCAVHLSADSLLPIAESLVALDVDFTLEGPPELTELLRRIAGRLTAVLG